MFPTLGSNQYLNAAISYSMPNIVDSSTYLKRDSTGDDNNLRFLVHHSGTIPALFDISVYQMGYYLNTFKNREKKNYFNTARLCHKSLTWNDCLNSELSKSRPSFSLSVFSVDSN